jgi:hypothetical protein
MLVVSRPYPEMTFFHHIGVKLRIDGGMCGIDHECP